MDFNNRWFVTLFWVTTQLFSCNLLKADAFCNFYEKHN